MQRTAPAPEAAAPGRFPWPPVVYLLAAALAALLHVFVPLPWFGSPFADILFAFGLITAGAGAAFVISAALAMRRAGTTVLPHRASERLVTTGAFAISRNPIYLGDTLVLFGVGLASGIAWLPILGLFAALATQALAILPEERHLDARFGKAFRAYRRNVRRWI